MRLGHFAGIRFGLACGAERAITLAKTDAGLSVPAEAHLAGDGSARVLSTLNAYPRTRAEPSPDSACRGVGG